MLAVHTVYNIFVEISLLQMKRKINLNTETLIMYKKMTVFFAIILNNLK